MYLITTGNHNLDTYSLKTTGYMRTFFLLGMSVVDDANLQWYIYLPNAKKKFFVKKQERESNSRIESYNSEYSEEWIDDSFF